ncbi:uncharacterized protein LOC126668313 [Mercurialis annua]|uniref:uncharacterized protein LOC126668313 n=1 Tax=Mercurialis annua TaxID=3986 RepID=UPI00215E0A3A|nr:uncharacterized protein LOC126668313 [Mercurialis annua]
MHDDTSPGLDGFNLAFYKCYWDIMSVDVVRVCREFFNTGNFCSSLTNIASLLIPKIKTQKQWVISDLSLCHARNRVSALNVDMSKTYDRVIWDFIRAMMLRLGFSAGWVNLVMACVTSVRYTSIRNNYDMEPIALSRGLRQGDPLSPNLFIIFTEGLTSLLVASDRQGSIHDISVYRNALSTSHLFFANNCYPIFFQANLKEMVEVKAILDKYEKLSGHRVNFGKSNLMFGAKVMNVKVVVDQ